MQKLLTHGGTKSVHESRMLLNGWSICMAEEVSGTHQFPPFKRKDCFSTWSVPIYRNDPKFSDRYAWANSVDPDQTAPRGAVLSGSTRLPFQLHLLDSFSMLEPCCSNFRIITAMFSSVRIFKKPYGTSCCSDDRETWNCQIRHHIWRQLYWNIVNY